MVDVIGEGRGPGGPIIARATKVLVFGEPTTAPMRLTSDVIDDKPQYTEIPPYLRTRIRTQPGLLMATTKAAPITLDAPIGPISVTQGGSANFQVIATRPQGVEAALTLSPMPLPKGLTIPEAKLGATATEATVTVNTTRELPPGRVTIVLTAQGKIAGTERLLAVPAVTLQIVPEAAP